MDLKEGDRVYLKENFLRVKRGWVGVVVNAEVKGNLLIYFPDLHKRKWGHTGGTKYNKIGCYWVFGEALKNLVKVKDTREQKEFEKLWV